ncbi:hypothetical protein STSP2_02588 [Anaerohalosphaera lusitana]|uniref:Uncharacterized protein n=1 Tax=Anaerohalosphaera lusitana TaxID=1936003 RepID=A0A1U9NND0_9BACT|nr:hypothetical protein [Anaerohalosphaera lusitana]AQT69399.1 hypothetical protein STSP2_02588 [Anaerohalosphaera lusitana]
MKKTSIFFPLIIIGICLSLTGCQDQTQSISERQARLVASQNMQLKAQLEQKDAEIANLQEELEDCRGQIAKMEEASAAAAGNMMEMIKSSTESLTKQNIELRAKVKELEAKLAKESAD